MLLSIIIPTLNESSSIEKTLMGLQPMRHQYCEIIVADGGSVDDTVELAKPLVDKIVHSEKGRACQMNYGALDAKGDWLLFLHADTILPASSDAWISQIQQTKKSWGFFYIKLSGRSVLLRVIERFINWRSSLTNVATGDQCLFVRRSLFDDCQGYKRIPLMEDVAFSKTLRTRHSPYLISSPVITSSRRWEERGIIKTVIQMWWLRLQYVCGVSPWQLVKKYYE